MGSTQNSERKTIQFVITSYKVDRILIMKKLLILILLHSLTACTALTPKNGDNICSTFREKEDWYDDTKNSFEKWGVPISVQMAIMHQESHFVADVQPPRPWLLGIIPLPRDSSAYGYAQAKDETWDDYKDKAGNWGADRDDFDDAADFIGWYCDISYTRLGISKLDAKNLYLAYHEGHSGYQRNSDDFPRHSYNQIQKRLQDRRFLL
jgi:hypothetical protein